ncbi:hypothetical protein [Actinomadura macra]|uniref:hypothetical protein n=1 Tax=Actinomadura macra TaxID=46164 RepID=UPI0012FB9C31|nr:hypothetical protein [Actinomadura macra]
MSGSGRTAAGAGPAVYRAIVCVDVQDFSDHRRTHDHQITVRNGLYHSLDRAFGRAGVAWSRDCYCEDRGDGALILVSPHVPKKLLVVEVIQELAAALADHNHIHDEYARIRLRMALHAGEVHHDAHGVASTAIILATRLLNAAPLKQALARSSGALAVIASQQIFEDVIWHTAASRPASYRKVQIPVNQTETTAWISLPDNPCRLCPPDAQTTPDQPRPA